MAVTKYNIKYARLRLILQPKRSIYSFNIFFYVRSWLLDKINRVAQIKEDRDNNDMYFYLIISQVTTVNISNIHYKSTKKSVINPSLSVKFFSTN